jgi:hypothetical protein
MASDINPNNINGAYPVAGQDNDSQGFRDNFTNIKTNFGYAETEITDLQNKAILKEALTGTVLDNDMNGSLLYNFQTQDLSFTRVALGTLSGSVTVDYSAGSYQTVTTSGSISIAFSNFPAAGAAGTVSLQISVASALHTVTFPAAVSVNNTGIVGWNTSTNVFTAAAAGTYTFVFTTSDGGTTIAVSQTNQRLQAFNNSQEDLASGSTISPVTAVSYFTTSGAETSTLDDGVEGQIKTLVAVNVAAGNMVVTVNSPGWTGAGTITFAAKGGTATLMFVQGAWYVIGSYSVTVA